MVTNFISLNHCQGLSGTMAELFAMNQGSGGNNCISYTENKQLEDKNEKQLS